MVKTRRSFEASNASPIVAERRSTRERKNNRILEEDSTDESAMEKAPISSRKRLRFNKEDLTRHEDSNKKLGKTKRQDVGSPEILRSTRGRRKGQRLNTQPKDERHNKTLGKAGQRRRRPPVEQELIEDVLPSIRRSCRQRRGVYDTLNVKMLTDHRYIHTYESFPAVEVKEQTEEQALEDALDDQDGNMYDHVKRRHETPTPEKRPRGVDDDDGDDEDDEEEDENDSDDDSDDEEDDEEEEDEERQSRKYLLRTRKPVVNRYIAPPMKTSRGKKEYHISLNKKHLRNHPPHASPVRRIHLHKRKAINMSSSTSSEDSCGEKDEQRFERRKNKSMAKARHRALPMNLTIEDISKGILRDRDRVGSSLADVDPMMIDSKVKFDSVGGLGKQIRALKEMILFPLMYPEVFEKFKINPPRGVLFYGPPGTGKTLVARALANECSQGDHKVAFFMRKGADCLSKWVGESERQLRLLFDQAYAMRPSIIFFDEIDGLAPVRSSRQDQIHSSIVSTLLALMDGLDSRGEVVVIGATNRIDAIDPALRRPGRFDREFQFPLPDKDARRSILSIHTREWEPKLSQAFINELADHCVGYCGADIKALCTEAALFALRRRYPQVYNSSKKLLLDVNSIELTFKDFFRATKNIVPAFQRSIASPARALSEIVQPLLENTFIKTLGILAKIFPQANTKKALESPPNQASSSRNDQRSKTAASVSDDDLSSEDDDDDVGPSIYDPASLVATGASLSRSERYMRRRHRLQPSNEDFPIGPKSFSLHDELLKGPVSFRPRLLLSGQEGGGQTSHLAPALLHSMEHLSVHSLDLPALFGVAARTPEEACSQLFREARRSSPCIIYMPHIHSLWNATSESLHATLLSLLQDLPPLSPILLLATAEKDLRVIPREIQNLFSTQTEQVVHVCVPSSEERKAFFHKTFLEYALYTPKMKKARKSKSQEELPIAPPPPPRQLSAAELNKIQMAEENTLRELRIFLRDIHHKLMVDRRFKEFSKPVDLEEVPDYLEVIDKPMDLSTMMQKIDRHQYDTCAHYLLDIDLITSNALKYNPDRDPFDKILRHRACELRDLAHSLIKSQLEPEFEKACEEIIDSRRRRGETSSACAPAYIHTLPRQRSSSRQNQECKTISENTENQPNNEETAIHTNTGSRQQPHARRRRKKPYMFGARRRIYKKKVVKINVEKENDINKEEGENEDVEQNGTEVTDGSGLDDTLDTSINSHNPQNDTNIHNKQGSSQVEDEGIEELNNGSPKQTNKGACDGDKEDATVQNGDLHQPECDLRANCSYASKGEKRSTKFLPNGLTATIAIRDIAEDESQELINSSTRDNKEIQEKENSLDEEEESRPEEKPVVHSEETINKWKDELHSLLTQVVDITEGYTVEELERYHSVLQLSIHQHRQLADKTELIKEFNNLITDWKYGGVR